MGIEAIQVMIAITTKIIHAFVKSSLIVFSTTNNGSPVEGVIEGVTHEK